MQLRYIYVFFIILLSIGKIHASSIKFQSYNLDDGLGNSTINDIYKDRNGLLWLGTIRGVNLFTGEEFIPLNHFISDTIHRTYSSANVISELKPNQLWVGTWGDGLYSVDIESGEYQHYRVHGNYTPNTITDNYINCLHSQHDDRLWIGAVYGLNVTNGDGTFEHFVFEEVLTKGEPDIRAIIQKYETLLILFTNDGEIIQMNTETGVYKKVAEVNLPFADMTDVVVDKKGNFWIGSEQGGLILLDKNYQQISLPTELQEHDGAHVADMHLDEKGNLIIATDGNGLLHINTDDFKSSHYLHNTHNPYSLINNQLQSLYYDENGILWLGYFKGGLSKAVLKEDGIEHFYKDAETTNELPNNIVNGFTEDKNGYIWIGTENGIGVFNRNEKSYQAIPPEYRKYINQIGSNPITAINYNHSENKVMVGTFNKGLFIIDIENDNITNFNTDNSELFSNFIRSVIFDDGTYYVATVGGGFYTLKNNEFSSIYIYHQNNYELKDFFHVTKIDGALWLSSAGGGTIRIDSSEFTGEMFDNINTRISYTTAVTADSSIYIGTDNGLYLFDEVENDFKHIDIVNIGTDVYGILEDYELNLWLSTSHGLFRYNPSNQKLTTISSINIQEKEYQPGSYAQLSDNKLIFGGINGFNIIDAEKFISPSIDQNLFINRFTVFNRIIKTGDTYAKKYQLKKQINYLNKITLPHHVNFFSFGVSVINYQINQRDLIAYTIKNNGITSDMYITNKEISFHNLPAGTYELNIYPVNKLDGSAQLTRGKTITVVKERAWWQTKWFFIGLGLFVLITVVVQYRMRLNKYKQNKILLEKTVSEKTIDLEHKKNELIKQRDELKKTLTKNQQLERFKESLISMIVHDLKNPLNSIIGLSSLNDALFLEHIHSASRQMLYMVENILDVRKYENSSLQLFYRKVNIKEHTDEAIEEVRFLLNKDNNIKIINNTEAITINLDPEIIKRVYINLLTNAIKYSPTNGEITISGKPDKNTIILSISDQGNGIPEEQHDSVFDLYKQLDAQKSGISNSTGLGLSFCKIAIEEHKGQIWVESNKNNGTIFNFRLPL
ncbi:ATP-binding protein [Carboxylicivirga sp. N1Y90]|uniref:sensor histidine kinase n=1 Tax=Carboxylicivirga fragile TaxID=3417571 RepID=UPI003D335A1F|nr:hypothetical protein [Marinilabiliaceae bacterium N1Y90]